MKNRTGRFRASCATLLLATNAAWACDEIANVPDTVAAQRSAELLDRAARALRAHFAGCATTGSQSIGKLWIFPTADANTVFVHYESSTDAAASSDGNRSRLLLLEMRGTQIAQLLDMSSVATDAETPVVLASGQH